jgi:hypothetical protein
MAMVAAEVGTTPAESVVGGETGQPADETAQGSGVSSRGSETARAETATSTTNLILPLAGLALISGGILLALLTRRSGGEKPADETKPEEP